MKQVHAEINHGRWIARCPACLENGVLSALEVAPGAPFICPTEFQNIGAETLVPNLRVAGAFNPVPDEPLREEARRSALEAGNWYEVVFPPKKAEIERLLRYRPVHARNWRAGTTLEELKRENATRGVKHA